LGSETDLSARWFHSRAGILAVWSGMLAGPIAWALDLLISYAIVQWSCGHDNRIVLRLITLVSLTIIAAGAYASWIAFEHTPSDMPFDPSEGRDHGTIVIERGRFMAVLGLLSSLLFAVLVIGLAVPRWVLDAC
jgi:hypothetical protein